MRILHTSDWHLGRSFHRVDLLDAQAAVLDALVDTVRTEGVDLVVVSGDVYDRALPPVDAVSLCDRTLRRLREVARVVLISGNHDSARRLGFGTELIDAAGVHLRTDVREAATPVLLDDEDGPVAIYAVPYLEPDAVRGELGDETLRGHADVLTAAMDRVRGDLSRRRDARSVVLGHAFVTGGAASDSERDITVGGVAAVPPSVFRGVDYVALGHLHGPQTLAETIRYSGSPLAYSFSEARQVKSFWLVDLGPRGVRRVQRVPCPVPRPLSVLRGRLANLLTDAAHSDAERHFVAVTLTDAGRPQDAMARLRERFPHALRLDWEPDGEAERSTDTYARAVRGRADTEIATSFVEHVRATSPTPGERDLLRNGFEAVRREEASV